MYEEDRLLAERCDRLSRETATAAEWLSRNAELVGRDYEGHIRETRRTGRLLRNCAVAARRKMCVGIFGPSQAGKSYLVSTLAGNAEGKLWTRLGNATHDFLGDLNPVGGTESTGLVTRFTLDAPVAPADFPVHVRLLTAVDVLKILSNTYFSDAEHEEKPDRQGMLAALDDLEKRRNDEPVGGMTRDDVEDLQEYIHKYFRGKPRVQQLFDQHFWDRVALLAPLLHDDDRAELFGILWNNIPPFTRIARELLAALRALDFAREAFCPAQALVPRDASIIDVAALRDLSPKPEDALEMSTPGGRRAALPRVYAAALTAELIISMPDKPDEFFTHTDLLDFPGYRSRKMFADLATAAEDPANLKDCFLRGKVAYLFERYCAERELTGLLLCIGSGPQEVQGLGNAVSDWIAGAHGSTPQWRSGKQNSLFFILTKSDMEFQIKAGAQDVSQQWEKRMQSSMELFSAHEWLHHWDDTGPFRNFFLIRSTKVEFPVFAYEGPADNRREAHVREDQQDKISEFAQAFRRSPLVAKHIALREESWQALMTPNDGGISLIRQKLDPICKPELKREQIATTVEEQLARLRDRLLPYYRTDDKEEERRQKALLAQNLARVILGLGRTRRFGAFLRLLSLRDQDIYDLYFQTRHQIQEKLSAARRTDTVADDLLVALMGEEALPTVAASAGTPETAEENAPLDEAQAFCEHIEKFWMGERRRQADDPALQCFFAFPPSLFSQFVHELGAGFARLGLRRTLEEALRKAARYANQEKERLVWKQAGIAASVINAYSDWLGFDPRTLSAEQRRITVGSKQRILFLSRPEPSGLPALAEDPGDYAETLLMDWAAALIHLVTENAGFDGVRDFDPEENARLQAVLQALTLRDQLR
jgi:hypothetical protein